MADLKEVVRRVKEAEKKKGEGKVTKIFCQDHVNILVVVNFR